jgi:hypothetical protein
MPAVFHPSLQYVASYVYYDSHSFLLTFLSICSYEIISLMALAKLLLQHLQELAPWRNMQRPF